MNRGSCRYNADGGQFGLWQRWVPGLLLILSLVAYLAVGVLYSVCKGSHTDYPDEAEYVTIARNILAGNGFSIDGVHPTAFRPPVFPLWLVGLSAIGRSVVILRIGNVVLFAMSVALAWCCLRRWMNHWWALAGAVALLGYPLFLYSAGTLFPQTLGVFLVMMWFICLVWSDDRWLLALLGGIAGGLLVLSIPSMALLIPVMAMCFAVKGSGCRWWLAIAFLFGVLAVCLPWTIRNSLVMRSPIPISTSGGSNLLLGNNPYATPQSGVNVDISAYLDRVECLGEVERDRVLRQEAVRWITQHPGDAASLYFGKVLHFFHFRNRLQTKTESSPFKDALLFVTYTPWLFLMAIRIVLWKEIPPHFAERCIIAMYVCGALTMAVFFTRIRFRVPLDFLLIIGGILFLHSLWRHLGGPAHAAVMRWLRVRSLLGTDGGNAS